jgi:LacI family transcriptional regulator
MKKATLKQIAKDLNVSISTVSKALNDSYEIGEKTKRKIKEYAELVNYKPNLLAKSLKSRKTMTIGVVVPNMMNPFFAKVFSGIEKEAKSQGYNVVSYISNESYENEKNALDLLSNGVVDGFIVSVAEETQKLNETSHFKKVLQNDMSLVLFDRILDDVDCNKVVVNDLESTFNATDYLLNVGLKNIALVTCIKDLSVAKLRKEGYLKALKNKGLQINEDYIIEANNEDQFDELFLKFINSNHPIDGIIGLDEHASTFAHKQMIKRGKNIPDDVSIIGFADGIWSRRLTPSLATISQHGPEIGAEAARLLIDQIKFEGEYYKPKTVSIKTELRTRASIKKL